MKRLIFLFLSSPIFSIAQSLPNIGPFHVGKSNSEVMEQVSGESRVKIKSSNSLRDVTLSKGTVKKRTTTILLLAESKDRFTKHAYYVNSPNIKVYFIDYYEISGVPFEKLYLKFFRDTLYEIHSKSSNTIDEAMTMKFGKPIMEEKRKKVECVSRLAGNFNVDEYKISSSWNTVDTNIIAHSYIHRYFDSKCEERFTDFFSCLEKNISRRAFEDEYLTEQKQIEDVRLKKKQQLKGF